MSWQLSNGNKTVPVGIYFVELCLKLYEFLIYEYANDSLVHRAEIIEVV